MTARKRSPRRSTVVRAAGAAAQRDGGRREQPAVPFAARLRPWFLALAVGLTAARTWIPSESAAEDGSGLSAVMLWIALAVVWALVATKGGASFRFGMADAAAVALVAWAAISALVSMRTGAPRPALNMLWEWVGLLLGFRLIRQLLADEREARLVLVVMVAMAAAHVGYGLYQDRVILPETQALYQHDPEAALRQAGVWAPAGSTERKQFEDRLLYSQGVLSTFALTNSLAGFLAPWLIVAVGIGLSAGGLPAGRQRVRWGALVCAGAMALCIWQTHSRAGLLAAVAGTVLLTAWKSGIFGWLRGWRWAFVAAGVALVGGSAAWALERWSLLDNARRSLGYRFDYWQATWAMIVDHPWLGVGPGAFQTWYTRYKLPTALEEVRDPHNFLLEIWATAGTPAAVAFAAVLVLCAAALVRGLRRAMPDAVAGKDFSPKDSSPFAGPAIDPVAIVAVIDAFVMAAVFGLLTDAGLSPMALLIGLPIAGVVLFTLQPWIDRGRLSPVLPAIAVGVMLINLLVAGGIALPAVAGSLWLLLAVGLNLAEGERPPRPMSVAGALALATAGCGLALGCYLTAYEPVLASRTEMALAMLDPRSSEKHLRAAAENDPWSSDPWLGLASLNLAKWNAGGSQPDATLTAFEEATARRLKLDPLRSRSWLQTGDWYAEIFERTRESRFAQQAARKYLRAVELYPTDAFRRARLAISLADSGQAEEAGEQRQRALELHEQSPHPEKKLPPELIERLRRIP